jgi:drug/metabolite transporter (DMT)-like permease
MSSHLSSVNQGLLNIALLYTDAMRVSFIAQTAIVLTPIISFLRGNAIRRSTWLACVVALVGVALLAGDGSAASAAATAAGSSFAIRMTLGDALALGGAATSSLYIYRMSEFGKKGLSTDQTQAVKVILLGALYSLWAICDGARLVATGGKWLTLWPGWTTGLAWALLLYSAIVPGAVADVLQARGQAKVEAAEAQVLLGAEPLWTAVLGIVLLNERLGAQGATGAALIVIAVLLAGGVADAVLAARRSRKAAALAA